MAKHDEKATDAGSEYTGSTVEGDERHKYRV
jgi:hypothetical protein